MIMFKFLFLKEQKKENPNKNLKFELLSNHYSFNF